ncbi:HeH/LEM domain-containing protein [Paenalcaligenes hominis]|uniref:HeH/LEM domain-containing protein n=1 Tax=Paenalcaligenes hominis TaxID=643674 RepID=UPI003524548E
MRLLYTKRRANFPEGFAVRNPHYFVKAEGGANLVAIEGSYPEIAEAYQKLGVSVEAFGDRADVKALDDMTVDELQAYLNELGVDFDAKAKKADLLKLAKEQ